MAGPHQWCKAQHDDLPGAEGSRSPHLLRKRGGFEALQLHTVLLPCPRLPATSPLIVPCCHAATSIRYWNDPEVLGKLGKAMGGSFDLPKPDEEQQEGEGEGEEEEAETIVAAASA
eukprot:804043-Pelagomonas_calceolata.AAC.1